MPKRIKDYASAATTIASDDYFAIDGATNGTRKALLTSIGTTGLLFGAGTAAAPKLAVGTASNGIYAPSGNTLGFSTNGAQQWRIDSFGTLVSDVQSTPVLRFQPALPGTTCGVEWFDTGAVLAAYAKYNVTSPQLEINAGKSGSTGRIVFYTNTTDVGRFTSSQCFLVGTTSETGLTGAAGMKVASTTLATSGSTGAFIVAGSAGFGKKCFITDGSTGAQLRLEYTAASVYTDLATLSTGHFLMTTTGGNRITSTTTNDTSVLARQVQGGLAFDGVTASSKDIHTIGADIGTSYVSLSSTFLVPTASGVNYGILTLTPSSTTGSIAYGFYAIINSAGALEIVLFGSSTGNYRIATLSGIITAYGGKIVNLTITKDTGITVYINGVAQTLTTNTFFGSDPGWTSQILSTYCFVGAYTSSVLFSGPIFSATIFNRALSASEVITLANQGVQEADKWGSLTGQTSGTLTRGKRYRITTFVAGDSFTNVGAASNATGVEFVATGTTPTTWTNASTLNQIGSILDADLSAGVGYQVPDRSSNKYHGVVSASGTSWTLPQRRGQLRVSTTASGNNQLLGAQVCLPTNAIITSIVGYTTGTPTVYVGNVSGGSQLVASVAMSASTYTSFTLAAITTTTGNVWANVSSAVTVNWTITYMIADP